MAAAATWRVKPLATVAALSAALVLGACANSGDSLEASLSKPIDGHDKTAAAVPQSELEKATEYWGKKYKEKPTELEPGLNYAKNLKAMGERQQALQIIQQLSVYHSDDKKLASEYGRLALELDQVSVAKQMLAIADDPSSPDWRVISARGTVLAKEGKYRDAIPYYEKAMSLSPDQSSVMNNLGLAYAMNGDAARGEELLRRLEAKGGTAKTRQNLALVLGLQGKFDEAKLLSARDLGADGAAQNSDYLRRMVKIEKPSDWNTTTRTGSARAAAKAAPDAADIAQPAAFDARPGDAIVTGSIKQVEPAGPGALRGMTR